MDKISVIGTNKQDNLLKTIRPLQEIEGLYRAIDMAEKVLTDYIGIPICQEHCGKCCELTTPDVWEVEARFMVSAFAGDGGTRLEAITKASEEWLLDRNPNLKTYGDPFGMRNLTDEEWRKFQPEVNHLLLESPCPYLTSDKRCLMHDTRALVCLSDDTEILTEDGWTGIDSISKGHKVISMNTETGKYQEEAVGDIVSFEYKGDMLQFGGKGKKQSVDALVTPDHRVVYRTNHRKNAHRWLVKPAAEIAEKVEWPVSGVVQKDDLDISDNMLKVIAWVLTDGTCGKYGRQRYFTISQSKSKYVEEIESLLLDTFGVIHKSVNLKNTGGPQNRAAIVQPQSRFFIGAAPSREVLRWFGEGTTNRIPRLILAKASTRQLRVFYEEMMKGDGNRRTGHDTSTFYPGKDEEFADDFQELATRLGIRTKINNRQDNPGDFVIQISPERIKAHTFKRGPEKVPYDGRVWCIMVPSGTFVARRKRTVFTTGNCRCFGVTRMPGQLCPRPISKIETQDSRAHIGTDSALGIQLRKMLMKTLKRADKVDWAWTYFLPTILFKIMKPEKFEAYVNDGRIATAKLTRLRTNTAILFQDQLNEMWARDSALVK